MNLPQKRLTVFGILVIVGALLSIFMAPQALGDADNMTNCTNQSLPNVRGCADSDGGLNFGEQGITIAGNGCFIDTCINSQWLSEYFCRVGKAEHWTQLCPAGTTCFNGACV